MQTIPSSKFPLIKLIEKKLWAKVLLGMILGIIAGYLLSVSKNALPDGSIDVIANWLAFPGKLFIKLVQMIMIALIISSIITGIGGSTGDQLKTIGLKSLVYFLITTVFAVLVGASLTYLINPGQYLTSGFSGEQISKTTELLPVTTNLTNFPDLILNLIPENPLASMLTGDMLSIVIFSLIIGVAITKLTHDVGSSVIRMMGAVQSICMNIVNWAMLIVPYAVFGIMAGLIATVGKESLQGLGVYTLTVLAGLFVIILFYLAIVFFVGRYNPFTFLKNIRDAVLLAFSTTSSAAVMPLSMKIAEEKLHVKKNVSDLIIPLGTTINMDGTALYQCVSFIFIMQVYGIDPTLPALLLSLFTIIAASIGTPAVPGAGIIVLASVLQNAGIPAEGIMTIIGMERILGMFRSAVNVTGDLAACLVFNRILK